MSLPPSGERDVVEDGVDLVLGSADDLLRLLAAQLLHGRVVVLLRLGQEHLQHAALVLLLQHVEVVDDHSEVGVKQIMVLGSVTESLDRNNFESSKPNRVKSMRTLDMWMIVQFDFQF